MKAILLLETHQLFTTEAGGTVEIHMDLYQLPTEAAERSKAEFKFSWIAFDTENPMRRVLFDSHPPKGPHYHLDDAPEGESFAWVSIENAIDLFREKVAEYFGELMAIPDEGELI